ncbi:uncharacterized protein LOC129317530 [Prosopis cineraria]|uniref:uncharacterized protein LOC129317530 n=1 Tax=Prosopis cineraria TaxID=364024 RepID=UPI00240FDB49|nr:uncharacterized protein LOC129317530 [Prosopis cineraria]
MVHPSSKANENDSCKPKEKEVLGRREPPKEYQIRDHIPRDMPFPKALTRFTKKAQEEDRHDVFDMLKKVEVNIPLLEMIKSMPKCAKFLKELCTNKRGFKPLATVQMSPNISAVFKPRLPLKCRDLGACTIPCQIGNVFIQEALIDLRAAINMMPTHIYSSLNLGGLQDCSVILQLADRSIRKPKGFLEDILVKVKDLVFPADFYVLDMQEGGQGILVLGRPFMMTSSTILNMKEGKLTMEFLDNMIEFNIFDSLKNSYVNYSLHFVDCIDDTLDGIIDEVSMPPNLDDVASLPSFTYSCTHDSICVNCNNIVFNPFVPNHSPRLEECSTCDVSGLGTLEKHEQSDFRAVNDLRGVQIGAESPESDLTEMGINFRAS